MTEQDRGAYTPQTDAPLAFDARMAHAGRPTQVPVTLILSGVVLLVMVVAIVVFYRTGLRGAGQAPLVVGAPSAEDKTAPPASAQPSSAASGLQIYQSEAPSAAAKDAPAFVPPPENAASRPPPPVAIAPAPAAPPPPAAAAVAPPPVVAPPPPRLRTSEAVTTEKTASAAGEPVAKQIKPAAKKPASAKPAVASAGASAGGARVQIGAFSSTAVADKGWSDTARLMPGRMDGKTRSVEPFAKDGTTFYRTFVGGFASKAEATKFCASLKVAGKACFVR